MDNPTVVAMKNLNKQKTLIKMLSMSLLVKELTQIVCEVQKKWFDLG